MDNLLSGLFGGNDDDDGVKRRDRANDFVSRVERGSPYDGFTEEEAVHNYQRVASNLSDDEYQDAARDAFSQLSPDERRQFAAYLREQEGVDAQGDLDDPDMLAQLTNRARRGQGGGLSSLLGGGGGGGDIMGALGGLMGGGRGGGSNTLMKGVLGTIASSAMRKYMR